MRLFYFGKMVLKNSCRIVDAHRNNRASGFFRNFKAAFVERQETGGYSITVNDLYLTGNSIYVDTNLIGPGPENREVYRVQEKDSASYPYVILKIEYMDKSVVFD